MLKIKSKSVPTPPYEINYCHSELVSESHHPTLTLPVQGGKQAFTLAEVLITLVIIGVIAAITIPTLITKYQKEQTVTSLKKAYTTLSQIVKLSEIENGTTDNWDYTLNAENFYNKYLKKYLISAKNFGNVNANALGIKYKSIRGAVLDNNHTITYDQYRISMNDGSMLFIGVPENNFKRIYIDINGYKPPNRLGRDVFSFSIQKKYKVTPYGLGYASRSFGTVINRNTIINTNYSESCNKNSSGGHWCAALIMGDGWRIADDYPW